MNETPCLYAIIRFAPFVAVGEFANVGIILLAPAQRYFGYMLLGNFERVARFFDQLDSGILRDVIVDLEDELAHMQLVVNQRWLANPNDTKEADMAKRLFMEIVRPRETVIRYSEVRCVLADDPGAKLKELHGRYVGRDFAAHEDQEIALERGMRALLEKAGVAPRFMQQTVGNNEYHADFPFVEQEGGICLRAIKPLYLAQDQPSKILDHGGQWLFRTQTLKKRNLLPKNMLFAVAGPTDGGAREQAYFEIVGSLQEAGVEVIPILDEPQILAYLRALEPCMVH